MQWMKRLLFIAVCSCAATESPGPSPHQPVSIATSSTNRQIGTLEPAKILRGRDRRARPGDRVVLRGAPDEAHLSDDGQAAVSAGRDDLVPADLRATGTLLGGPPVGLTVQLISPRGSIVATKRVLVQNGVARNDLELSDEIEGGEYVVRLTADDGTTETKKLVINTYEAPRLMKTLELLRKAYGEGDQVSAAVEVKRTTGEPLADKAMTAVVTLDDVEIQRLPIKSDREGKTSVRFALPGKIARGDGLLTILVEDGGVTESIQKRIPIVMKTLQFAVFPEGGDLVDNVPGRVYFMAKTTIGKPADVQGRVLDDRGQVVAELTSLHDGMGRFELTPQPDRKYRIEITKPAGITAKFDVPTAKPGGCVVRSVDQANPATLGSRRSATRRGGCSSRPPCASTAWRAARSRSRPTHRRSSSCRSTRTGRGRSG